MPNCYLLVASRGESLDGCIETIRAPELPIHSDTLLHGYWEFGPGERNALFEVRVVLRTPSGESGLLNPAPLRSTVSFQKMMMRFPLKLAAPGCYALVAEWRRAGTEHWTRGSAYWPFRVEVGPIPVLN